MNTITKNILYILFAAFFMFPNFAWSMGADASQSAIPGLPAMSPEEMQKFQADLEQLGKMMEGMSEKEQEQFLDALVQDAMEEVKKDLSDEGKNIIDRLDRGEVLTDEDWDKVLKELVPESEKKEEPIQKKEETPQKKAVEPKPVLTSKHQAALDLINSLINHTNMFILKAGSIPELSGRISAWAKENKIQWEANLTWNTFRNNLDSFVSKLEKLRTQDKKTKQYPHIDELLKNQTLYNHLSKIEKEAALLEPDIEELSLIGPQKVTDKSKQALRSLISNYVELLYTLKISEALDALFAQFEPKAQLSREAELEAEKKAKQEQKKPRVPGKPVVGGVSESEYYPPYFEPDAQESSYYDSNANGPFIPSYASDNGARSNYSPSEKSPHSSGRAPVQKGKKLDNVTAENKKEKNNDEKKESFDVALAPDVKKNLELEQKYVKEGEKAFEELAALLKDNKQLQELAQVAKTEEPFNKKMVQEDIPELHLKVRDTQRTLSKLNESIKDSSLKSSAKKKLKKESKKSSDHITAFIDQVTVLENQKNELPLVKQYAYFGTDLNDEQYILTELAHLFTPAQGEQFEKAITSEQLDTVEKIVKKSAEILDQDSQEKLIKNIELMKHTKTEVPHPISLSAIKEIMKEIVASTDDK